MTLLLYTVSACYFIQTSHCCSHLELHDHDSQDDHQHPAHTPLAETSTSLLCNQDTPFFSQPHCCGKGLDHGDREQTPHVANAQNLLDRKPFPEAFCHFNDEAGSQSSPAEPDLIVSGFPYFFARSPALQSLRTVLLLI